MRLRPSTRFIVCSDRVFTLLEGCVEAVEAVYASGGISVLSAASDWREKLAPDMLAALVTERYLDYFDVVAHTDERKVWPVLSAALFDFIADSYEEWIDRERNLDNIRTLIEIIDSASEHSIHTLLDFGCGVGLSKQVTDSLGLRVIGFDPSPKMRQLAAQSGIEAWGPAEFARSAAARVDGAFASYVFDLYPTSAQLASAWSAIRPGGVFVGNCHKGRGARHVADALERQGALRVALPPTPKSAHGAYMAFKKGT